MKVLVDMNLTPDWVAALRRGGWEAIHWSSIGDPRASDETILDWAVRNDHVVFTHDLDFGAILAATGGRGPSVVQVRTQNVMPDHLGSLIGSLLTAFQAVLESGALISVDEARSRVRILPLNQD